MTYTEEEAAERWCPYMKLSDRSRGFCAACLGSGCMMWRWDNDETGCCKQNGEGLENYRGYCGLAGKP